MQSLVTGGDLSNDSLNLADLHLGGGKHLLQLGAGGGIRQGQGHNLRVGQLDASSLGEVLDRGDIPGDPSTRASLRVGDNLVGKSLAPRHQRGGLGSADNRRNLGDTLRELDACANPKRGNHYGVEHHRRPLGGLNICQRGGCVSGVIVAKRTIQHLDAAKPALGLGGVPVLLQHLGLVEYLGVRHRLEAGGTLVPVAQSRHPASHAAHHRVAGGVGLHLEEHPVGIGGGGGEVVQLGDGLDRAVEHAVNALETGTLRDVALGAVVVQATHQLWNLGVGGEILRQLEADVVHLGSVGHTLELGGGRLVQLDDLSGGAAEGLLHLVAEVAVLGDAGRDDLIHHGDASNRLGCADDKVSGCHSRACRQLDDAPGGVTDEAVRPLLHEVRVVPHGLRLGVGVRQREQVVGQVLANPATVHIHRVVAGGTLTDGASQVDAPATERVPAGRTDGLDDHGVSASLGG